MPFTVGSVPYVNAIPLTAMFAPLPLREAEGEGCELANRGGGSGTSPDTSPKSSIVNRQSSIAMAPNTQHPTTLHRRQRTLRQPHPATRHVRPPPLERCEERGL